jgi:hypothetical protein
VRWIVASCDISDHIEGSPSAHMALVYDPGDDRIISGHVDASPSGAVASAFERLDNPSGREPDTLACDKRVIQAVRLQCAGFKSTPEVVLARDQDLLACAAIFKDFLDKSNPAAVHEAALRALDEPARIFLESACWEDRADSEPLLLDAVIDGERVGGLISVMGNGGETWGISVFPDGPAYSAMIDGDEPSMPADGVISCIVEPSAVSDPEAPVVSMAIAINGGEPIPATFEQSRLLHVALIAAAQAPTVGTAEPAVGKVEARAFHAAFTVFDVEGAQAALANEQPSAVTPKSKHPALRFGELPREVANRLVSPDDELAWECLTSLPRGTGIPAVFIGCDGMDETREVVRAIEAGNYLGVTAAGGLGGTTIRLIGLSDPIVLGIVGTLWPPLRGFMRRRERSAGLHAVVVAPKQSGDPEGIFICVLPLSADSTSEGKTRPRGSRPPSPRSKRPKAPRR